MRREALEAQMKALMGEATPKATPKTKPKADMPKAPPGKALMAALLVGGALFGALITGFFHSAPVPPSAASDLVESLGEPRDKAKIDTCLFYLGVGRYRK
ncbi:hypothetical protein [Desulfoluna sp.]|uniref:hypothetical protein n=1 Tax=Desulfoluna sp. TaxID=2045199 RepID=UPI002635CC5A|nr:hypothetical protein [Desulfoluna sp.]